MILNVDCNDSNKIITPTPQPHQPPATATARTHHTPPTSRELEVMASIWARARRETPKTEEELAAEDEALFVVLGSSGRVWGTGSSPAARVYSDLSAVLGEGLNCDWRVHRLLDPRTLQQPKQCAPQDALAETSRGTDFSTSNCSLLEELRRDCVMCCYPMYVLSSVCAVLTVITYLQVR